jgi:NB-ARC domain
MADIPERVDDRARMYRARLADRRVLVVLDNAADEAQVRPLLPGTAGCAVLVTSRSRMAALAGSHSVFLDVMPADQSAELLAMIVGRERAEAEAAAVEEIARLCGFLPLAIRIAGARLESRPAWRISWFAERLRDESRRLDLLKAGDLEVRASFALSYEGESTDARRAFRFAGIMPSDFPAWNLAALLGTDTDHAEQLLEELVDAQLVEVIGVDAIGLIRYGLHDLLRDFARERLAGSESPAVRREALSRLAQKLIDTARAASTILQPGTAGAEPYGDPPQVIAVVQGDPQNWFTAERANLISLVRLVHDAELWEQTWHLTQALTVMLSWRADWRAWDQTQHERRLSSRSALASPSGDALTRHLVQRGSRSVCRVQRARRTRHWNAHHVVRQIAPGRAEARGLVPDEEQGRLSQIEIEDVHVALLIGAHYLDGTPALALAVKPGHDLAMRGDAHRRQGEDRAGARTYAFRVVNVRGMTGDDHAAGPECIRRSDDRAYVPRAGRPVEQDAQEVGADIDPIQVISRNLHYGDDLRSGLVLLAEVDEEIGSHGDLFGTVRVQQTLCPP